MALLLRLWLLRQRGVLRQFGRSMRQPSRAVSVLLVLVAIGFLAWTALANRDQAQSISRESLAVLGAMVFSMSVASGFAQTGPRFAPADVDFLFPAPFTPRQLLIWRLLQMWPLTLVSTSFMLLAFGLRVERPERFLIGMTLLQLTALHLQLLVAVLISRCSDAVAARLRSAGRSFALLALFGALAYLVWTVMERGGVAELIGPVATSPTARLLFFPAAACSDYVFGETSLGVAWALARLAIGAAGTLALLLLPDIDFLEESVATTARLAKVTRRRDGVVVESAEGRSGRSLMLPPSPLLFRGAGALVWKNLIVLARSWRSVVPGLLIGLMVVLPAAWTVRRGVATNVALGSLLMATIFWSSALAFDLRREFDRLEELRALPLSSTTLVLAELLVPWVLGVVLQESLLLVLIRCDPTGTFAGAGPALAIPLLMFLAVVIDNLALFIFAGKGSGPRGQQGGSPLQLLRPVAWLAAAAPGVLLWWWLLPRVEDPYWAVAAGVGLAAAITACLFFLLVRLYEVRSAEAAG